MSKVSEAELNAMIEELFKALDKDGSGFLEKPEIHQIAENMHKKTDGEGDFNEEAFEKGFGILDKNGDGKIALAELQAWTINVAKKRGVLADE